MKNYRMATAIGMIDDDIVAESINTKAVRRNSIWLRMCAAAACAACVLGIAGVGAYAYYTPTSYVSLDVNPSIEYSLNAFDRVLTVIGVNDDGNDILEDIGLTKLKNKAIDKAIRETINAIAKQGYFPEDSEGGVVIAVSEKQAEKAEKLSEKLKQTVEEAVGEEELDVEVESVAVGEARVQEARSLGVTPGKLNLVEKLQASAQNADDIDIEEWLNKSVKDIMKQTKANKALSKGKESDTSEDSNDSSGADEDKVLDSGVPSKNANKPDKEADNKNKDKDSDKTDKSNNGNGANKSDNTDGTNASADGTNGSNKSDNSTNNGQSKKLYAQTDTDDDSSSESSEVSSDKGNSGKSDNSGNNGQTKKAETKADSDEEETSSETSEASSDKGKSADNNSGKSNSSGKSSKK